MYSISPSDVERYHLRLLLLHTPGACSFDDLKTVDDQVCQTFMEVAKRRGLLRDDTEYERCMAEAVMFQMPQQLRTLFCVILLYCNPTKSIDLWNSCKAHMAEDFMQHVDAQTAEAMAFCAIEGKLKEQGRSCSDFGIPSPTSVPYSFEPKIINKEEELRIGQEMYTMLNQDQRSAADDILATHRKESTTIGSCFFIDGPGGTGKTYLYNTLDFGIPSPTSVPYSFESKVINKEEELRAGQEMYAMLNQDQRSVADAILGSHGKQTTTTAGSCFFIDGPGGTGKTYLYNTLYHLFMGQGVHVMTVAWTGIASSLLPEGRTVHSRFKLPVPILKTSTSSIRPNSKEAEEIRKTQVFIWDEAPMAPCYALNAVDILLRDIMNIDAPFGGKIIILGGDFRQVLPVIRFANRSELIAASLKSSNLWPYFKVMHLHQNMRTGPGEEEFSKWLIKLGNGELTSNEDDEIELPSSCMLNGNLVDEIFGQHISIEDVPTLCNRTILCPKNEHSLLVNEEVLQRLPETEKTYTSVDDVECEDGDDVTNYPTEFLNSLTPSGVSPHKLKLKIGAIVMLLRNLDVHQGLCNGIRLIVRRLLNHTIDCEVATGSNKGSRVLIPRITLTPSDPFLPFQLRRHQFPIRLSFAMTINKSQGQTFDRLGLLLPQPVFSHGQLYVAFSRVRSLTSIKVQIIKEERNSERHKTKNIVFKEIL
ncbi:unnamed protein product [Rotaria sp. Silwood1]|nr:unnamed protein product [Rotaria sp. Silwood1]